MLCRKGEKTLRSLPSTSQPKLWCSSTRPAVLRRVRGRARDPPRTVTARTRSAAPARGCANGCGFGQVEAAPTNRAILLRHPTAAPFPASSEARPVALAKAAPTLDGRPMVGHSTATALRTASVDGAASLFREAQALCAGRSQRLGWRSASVARRAATPTPSAGKKPSRADAATPMARLFLAFAGEATSCVPPPRRTQTASVLSARSGTLKEYRCPRANPTGVGARRMCQ